MRLHVMWHEIEDKQHAAGSQTLRQPRGGQGLVVKVVEASAYAGDVEVAKNR